MSKAREYIGAQNDMDWELSREINLRQIELLTDQESMEIEEEFFSEVPIPRISGPNHLKVEEEMRDNGWEMVVKNADTVREQEDGWLVYIHGRIYLYSGESGTQNRRIQLVSENDVLD